MRVSITFVSPSGLGVGGGYGGIVHQVRQRVYGAEGVSPTLGILPRAVPERKGLRSDGGILIEGRGPVTILGTNHLRENGRLPGWAILPDPSSHAPRTT